MEDWPFSIAENKGVRAAIIDFVAALIPFNMKEVTV